MSKRRKSGPRDGLYARLFGNLSSAPKPKKPWRKLTSIERSRIAAGRALFRSSNNRSKYQKLSRLIKAVRHETGWSQKVLALHLGVSLSSVKRWEQAAGFEPRQAVMDKLKSLLRDK